MTNLLPCPFCGWEAIKRPEIECWENTIICLRCKVTAVDTEDWNTRVGTLLDDIPVDIAEDNYPYICDVCRHYDDCIACETCRVTGFDPK